MTKNKAKKIEKKSEEKSDLHKLNTTSDIDKLDIKKSINLTDTSSTEAYYSNRYGWTLRRTV